MKISYFIFFSICLWFFSCTGRNIGWDTGMRNIFDYAKTVSDTSQLRMQSFGGSMPEGHFSLLIASFDRNEEADFDKVRLSIVDIIEGLLANINQDEHLRPYLSHFPFTYQDLEIALTFSNKEGNFAMNNQIAHVSLIKGRLIYAIHNEESQRLETIAREPYVEALEKIKGKNEENLLSVADPS